MTVDESDVTVISEKNKYIKRGFSVLHSARKRLKGYIAQHPEFEKSYDPLSVMSEEPVIRRMSQASELTGVGPMAGVAGVLADLMSEAMLEAGASIAVVENGGEIMITSSDDIYIGLFSLTTILKGTVGFLFKGGSPPVGLGTSSGTFGHATSLGEADTVTVFAANAGIADAAATRIANAVKGEDIEDSIEKGLAVAEELDIVRGVFIGRSELIGTYGDLPELISIDGELKNKYTETDFL